MSVLREEEERGWGSTVKDAKKQLRFRGASLFRKFVGENENENAFNVPLYIRHSTISLPHIENHLRKITRYTNHQNEIGRSSSIGYFPKPTSLRIVKRNHFTNIKTKMSNLKMTTYQNKAIVLWPHMTGLKRWIT